MPRLVIGSVLALAGGLALAHAQATPPQFRGGVNTVSIYASVFGADGRLVTGLTRDDFEIYDDGRKRDLSVFDNALQPITVIAMLDRSVSVLGVMDLERRGAEMFVSNLIPADRARIGSFNGRIEIDPPTFTSDHDELIRILHMSLLDAGVTPLWNATSAAMNALAALDGRRVILLMTDGYDNPANPGRNTITLGQIRGRLQNEGVMVYAIGLTGSCGSPAPISTSPSDPVSPSRSDRRFDKQSFRASTAQKVLNPPKPQPPIPGIPSMNPKTPPPPTSGLDPVGTGNNGPSISIPLDKLFGNGLGENRCPSPTPNTSLRELAADSGGGYVDLTVTSDLSATFARVADELHHQYLLGFTLTSLDGRTHTLDVRVRDPKLTVRARRTYLAK